MFFHHISKCYETTMRTKGMNICERPREISKLPQSSVRFDLLALVQSSIHPYNGENCRVTLQQHQTIDKDGFEETDSCWHFMETRNGYDCWCGDYTEVNLELDAQQASEIANVHELHHPPSHECMMFHPTIC